MAKSGDMLLKRIKGGVASTLFIFGMSVGICSGCTSQHIDSIRPDLNKDGSGMFLPPDNFSFNSSVETGPDASLPGFGERDDNIHNSSATDGNSGGVQVETTVNTKAPFRETTLDANTYYRSYLNPHVSGKLNAIVESISDSSNKSKIYARVMHSGYLAPSDNSGVASRMAYHDDTIMLSKDNVGGESLPLFALSYLQTLTDQPQTSDNANAINNATKRYIETLKTLGSETTALSCTNLLVRTMWSRDDITSLHNDLNGYIGFCSSASSNSQWLGLIPNITFKIPINNFFTGDVVVNQVHENSSVSRANVAGSGAYRNAMSVESLANLFTPWNPYPKRDADVSTYFAYDDYSFVYADISGHSKTLIVFGSSCDSTLKDVLGTEGYNDLKSVFLNEDESCKILSNTEYERLQEVATIGESSLIYRGTEVK